MNKRTLSLVQGALIAALYAALVYAQNLLLPGTTSMMVQFRVAELLCIFALWTPAAIWGLTIGCVLANIGNIGQLPLDVLFGSLATLLAAVCIWKFRNIRFKGLPLLSLSMPAIFNAIIVGLELKFYLGDESPLWLLCLCVAAGEVVVVLIAGTPLAVLIEKKGYLEKMKLK
ncbi:MAG: QueT transporter family protein [Clostridia bacterium]|nr:QueT transporter family protein [Clostridia bacterium]